MTSIRTSFVAQLFALLLLFGLAHISNASEITGTLSSDGSSPGTSNEVRVQNQDATGQALAQNQSNGQLQGSVVQGREETSALAPLADTSLNTTWIITLAGGVALITLAFLWYRRVL